MNVVTNDTFTARIEDTLEWSLLGATHVQDIKQAYRDVTLHRRTVTHLAKRVGTTLTARAKEEGRRANGRGLVSGDCCFLKGTLLRGYWQLGFDEAEAARVRKQEAKVKAGARAFQQLLMMETKSPSTRSEAVGWDVEGGHCWRPGPVGLCPPSRGMFTYDTPLAALGNGWRLMDPPRPADGGRYEWWFERMVDEGGEGV